MVMGTGADPAPSLTELIEQGKADGFVTLDDVAELFDGDEPPSLQQIDVVRRALGSAGVELMKRRSTRWPDWCRWRSGPRGRCRPTRSGSTCVTFTTCHC
jgi:hypothetical protein